MQPVVIDNQNSESIDIVKYSLLLWHWAWLIALVVVIAVGGTYFISKLSAPVYQARTSILVDMAPSNKSIDYNSVLLSSQLTQTYAQMIVKTPVLSEVATRLGLASVNPKAITAKPVTSTQLINIFAESTDPMLAADIANTLVAVFADQVQSIQATRFSASEQSLQAQMAEIESKIALANEQLVNTTERIEKDRLETTIANYNQTYSSLLQSYEQVRLTAAQTQSSIVQVEPAIVPIDPIRPRTFVNIAIAGLLSGILTCSLIIGIDLVNDTVKTPEEVTEKLGLPVLGVISHFNSTDEKPISESQPLSAESEAYRTLRTNINYSGAGINKPLRSIMITSAMPGEGKTDVVVNLGVVLAQNGQKVLLIDADMRRPSIHNRLALNNHLGLSQLFSHPELAVDYSLQPTRIKGLTALTSGELQPNPSELLGSHYMGSILKGLKSHYDIVLIDTPPALAVTDSAVMLGLVEGVIFVIKSGSTHLAPLRRMVDQYRHLDANLLGVVLNDINLGDFSSGYYYKHNKYSNAGPNHKKSKQPKNNLEKFVRKPKNSVKKNLIVK